MSKKTASVVDSEDQQVATRRARKAQQKAGHAPKDPNGKVARTVRADKTLAALNVKFKSKTTEFRYAVSAALQAYAKSHNRPGCTPLDSAFSVLDRQYAGRLNASEIRQIKTAIKAELSAH